MVSIGGETSTYELVIYIVLKRWILLDVGIHLNNGC